jgi:hypothetical protein
MISPSEGQGKFMFERNIVASEFLKNIPYPVGLKLEKDKILSKVENVFCGLKEGNTLNFSYEREVVFYFSAAEKKAIPVVFS